MRSPAQSKLAQFTCALALGLPACMPPAQVEPSVEPSGAQPEASRPRYARSSGSVSIYADPSLNAQHVELQAGPDTPAQRVVELIEPDPSGAWWRVRTLVPRQALALGLDPGAALAVLSLEGWVDAGDLVEFEPRAASQAQPSPSSSSPDVDETTAPDRGGPVLLEVAGGTLLHWPDGRVAGETVESHYFHAAATLMLGADCEQRLLCHERRAAPGVGVVRGWLCTSQDELPDASVVDPKLIALDEPRSRSPAVAPQASGEAKGALERNVIRDVVRAHLHEVRDCYNAGLSKDPALQGRVSINFVISGGGTVSSALVGEDSLGDPAVGLCIAKAIKAWTFPEPRGGGNVIVTYPFNLVPG